MSHFPDPADDFAHTLQTYITRSGYHMSQVARRADIPKRTLANWVSGYVRKPRQPDDLLRVCYALHLSMSETRQLFRLAGLPTPAGLVSAPPFHIGLDLPYFVGRQAEIEAITTAVREGRAPPVIALVGMAGVGKTALAWHLAYRLRPYFPDGVLWARLDHSALESILASFTLAFGVEVGTLPDSDSKARVLRTLLTTKRALIILDNATSFEAVEPLLPPTGFGLALITSQQQGFGALQGVARYTLQPFQEEEAWELMHHFLPAPRIMREQAALGALVRGVGGLPLALGLALSRLASEPGWTAEAFLSHIGATEGLESLHQTFQLAYAGLPPAYQRTFRALALLGSSDILTEAVAAILEQSPAQTQADLNGLVRASLLTYVRPETYRLHPLVWQFARHLPQDSEWSARYVAYYLAYGKTHLLEYARLHAVLPHLLAVIDTAAAWQRHDWRLTGIENIFAYLEDYGLLAQLEGRLHSLYLAVSGTEDLLLAGAAYYYSRLLRRLGRWAEAETLAQEALRLAEIYQDERLCLLSHNSLGIHAQEREDWAEALAHFQQARLLIERSKRYAYRYSNLINTAAVLHRLGREEEAERDLLFMLALTEDEPPENHLIQIMVCHACLVLCQIAQGRGDVARREAYYQRGVGLARGLGHAALEREFMSILP